MKDNFHPDWHDDCVVTCACGQTFTTGSIQSQIKVDICSACHPFFTGEMKFVDTQGRVDRFIQKMQSAQQSRSSQSKRQKKFQKKSAVSETKSYRQLLQEQGQMLKKTASSTAAAVKSTLSSPAH